MLSSVDTCWVTCCFFLFLTESRASLQLLYNLFVLCCNACLVGCANFFLWLPWRPVLLDQIIRPLVLAAGAMTKNIRLSFYRYNFWIAIAYTKYRNLNMYICTYTYYSGKTNWTYHMNKRNHRCFICLTRHSTDVDFKVER